MRNLLRIFLPILGILLPMTVLTACRDRMTYGEALQAMSESATSAKGESMTQEIIEISTDFTIGGAVEDAAQELHDWLASQIECSEVTVDGATVTVDFGTLEDDCTYRDHTYAGLWTITVQSNRDDEVVVDHEWTDLTNGEVTLDGQAQVTWSEDDHSRRVVHGVTWSDDERVIEASGDRLQTLLDPDAGLDAGIMVEGEREWVSDGGTWTLDIDAVEMRGQDPVPQAGLYTLTTPDLDVVTLDFQRLDEDTIEATLACSWKTWVFHVSADGRITREPEDR